VRSSIAVSSPDPDRYIRAAPETSSFVRSRLFLYQALKVGWLILAYDEKLSMYQRMSSLTDLSAC
jgi:hypothetical protein